MQLNKAMLVLCLPVLASLGGCMTPVGPVEVTRFHAADRISELGSGTISVVAGEGIDSESLEFRAIAAAVGRELQRVGYVLPYAGEAAHDGAVATVRFERELRPGGTGRGPVSVGVGGSTGSYGSGLGLGIGFNLGGKPGDLVISQLSVTIRARDGAVLWEGRAIGEARAGSPAAETSLAASKLAASLFQGFPGESGETIAVP
ncbi:MAG: DUF4136 domain-containing protein [Blastomonas sp.]